MLKSTMITEEQIYELHKKYCHGKYYEKLLDLCWTHCQIVKKIALQIAAELKKNYSIEVDGDLIKAGALVHDIGLYNCLDDNFQKVVRYATHGLIGYEILKKEGVEEKVARFSLCHTAGLTKEEIIAQEIPMEAKDYIPITLEEEIVSYADTFHSKGHPGFNTYEKMEDKYSKYGDNAVTMLRRFRKKFGLPELNELEKEYREWHAEINKLLANIEKK